jgi:hypothetical protein
MRSAPGRTALVLAGYAIFAGWLFRPTPSLLAHTLPAFHGLVGDALFHTWGTCHVSRTILVDPLHLFEAGIFYPARHTLAFGDHMIGEGILGLPVWLATHNPLLEFNLISLAAFVLCATMAFRYRHESGGGLAGAAAAGLVFSFTPFRLSSLLWPQVLSTFAMPLALAAWLRFVRDRRPRDWAAWVVWWVVHSLMGLYVAFYFAIVMGGLALAALVWAPTDDRPRLARATVAAPLATGVLLAPTLWPYLVLRATQGQVRTQGFGTHWTFILPGAGTWSGRLAGFDGTLGSSTLLSFGPGFFTSAVVLAGIVLARRSARTAWSRFLWRTNLLGLVIALLLVFVPVELQLRLPGFDTLRLTNRAFHVGLLFVAWFAGAAVDAMVASASKARLRAAIAAALVLLLALDAGVPYPERRRLPLGHELPAVYTAVRAMPEPVLYERTAGPEATTLAMYYSIFHGKALVNGYSGFTSPGAAYAIYRLFEFPSASARALLGALDVHAVVLREADAAGLERRLAALPDATVVFRDGASALVRVPTPPPTPLEPAAPLPRTGWSLDASDGRSMLAALVDGDARSVWRVEASRAAPPWLSVDLGAVASVTGVRCMRGPVDEPGVYLADVQTSLDGVTWTTTPARFEPDSLATLYQHPDEVRWWEARFPATNARYVRLVNARLAFWGGAWEIADLDVLTPTRGSAR